LNLRLAPGRKGKVLTEEGVLREGRDPHLTATWFDDSKYGSIVRRQVFCGPRGRARGKGVELPSKERNYHQQRADRVGTPSESGVVKRYDGEGGFGGGKEEGKGSESR